MAVLDLTEAGTDFGILDVLEAQRSFMPEHFDHLALSREGQVSFYRELAEKQVEEACVDQSLVVESGPWVGMKIEVV